MIKNIVFDMGQVLIHWSAQRMTALLELPQEDAKLIELELFRNVEWTQLDRGTITEESAIASVCRRLPEHLHEGVARLITGWWKWPLVPVAGMADLIRELKEMGYGIYLLSNASSRLHEYFHRIPGAECFDGKVVSADLKFLKPQAEIYQTLYSNFRLDPEECVFIDDVPANIDGAIMTGMNGVVFHGDIARLRRELRALGIPVSESEMAAT